MWIEVTDGHQDAVAVHMVVVWYMVKGGWWVDDKMDDRVTGGVTEKHTR